MAGTRKTRVPMVEQIRLINECRQSGVTDADWCRENDIAVSTFYNWVSRCWKTAADQIPAAHSKSFLRPTTKYLLGLYTLNPYFFSNHLLLLGSSK